MHRATNLEPNIVEKLACNWTFNDVAMMVLCTCESFNCQRNVRTYMSTLFGMYEDCWVVAILFNNIIFTVWNA